jgi:methylated-DNA-[protein]-cysteine S-methyltransferase
MNRINIQRHDIDIGELLIGSFDDRLCLLWFGTSEIGKAVEDRISKKLDAKFVERNDEVLEKTRKQVDEYFSGNRKEFDIPLLMIGTDFQRRVWKALIRIPYGATSTYGKIAEDIGIPRAVRAVGGAAGANPISIIIPCHRVIGSNGGLVGYGGGLPLKKWLLRLEQGDTRTQTNRVKII